MAINLNSRITRAASALGLSIVLSAGLAPLASAVPAVDVQGLFKQSSSSAVPGIKLPGIPQAPKKQKPAPTPRVAEDVRAATANHLMDMGHSPSREGYSIAREWAAQAAQGKATFSGKVGHGTTHLKEGTGNIYRLTAKEAKDRVVWLDREANKSPETHRFGTAVATDGKYIYLVEYFLN